MAPRRFAPLHRPHVRTWRFAVVVALAALTPGAATAEEAGPVNVLDLALRTGAALEWHPLRELGALVRDGRQVHFRVGTPWVLTEQNVPLFTGAVRRDGGAVTLSSDGASLVSSYLLPETNLPQRRVAAIMIDPGHGGRDPGTIGSHRIGDGTLTLQEKDVVLDASLRLHRLLAARYPDKQVLLTRDDDTYVSLEGRVTQANEVATGEQEAVMFVSVHANASLDRSSRGFEVWYLPPEFRRTLITEAEVEEGSEALVPILNTMLEEEYTRESVMLARGVVASLERAVGELSPNRGIREESWFVVRNAEMPAILIELGFATNRDEAQLLASGVYLETLAEAIYSAIESFVGTYESSEGFTRT